MEQGTGGKIEGGDLIFENSSILILIGCWEKRLTKMRWSFQRGGKRVKSGSPPVSGRYFVVQVNIDVLSFTVFSCTCTMQTLVHHAI